MVAGLRRSLARHFDRVSFPRALLGTAVSAAVLLLLGAGIRLGAPPKVQLITGYGFADNRRLLLHYALLLLAVGIGPFVALLPVPRRPGRAAGPAAPDDESPPAETTRRPAPTWRIAVPLGAAVLFGLFFVGHGVAYRGINGHEMVHFGYLSEIAHGKVLNVDTRVTYGPLLGYSLYGFMKLVSFDLYGSRLYWNVVTAGFLFLLWWTLRARIRNRLLLGLLVLYLVLYTTARYYLPDLRGINGGFWGWGNVARQGWMPLALLALAGPLSRGRVGWPHLAAGALVVGGGFYAQETLAPGLIVFGSCAVLWSSNRADPRWLRVALWSIAGAALAWGTIMAPVLVRGGLGTFLKASDEIPRLFLAGFGNRPYPALLPGGFDGLVRNLPYYLLPGGILLALLFCWTEILRDRRGIEIDFGLALYAALSYVNVLVRADPPHLLNVMVAPLLLLFFAADRWSAGRERQPGLRCWALIALLALPLLVFRPGLLHVARGLAGRILHPIPAAPAGLVRMPVDRAGIWTEPDNWFDDAKWGSSDDPAAAEMMRRLAGGRPVLIAGAKSSLYYFLTGLPCAVPFTDLSSECFTRESFQELGDRFLAVRPDFVFAPEDAPKLGPPPGTRYRCLGKAHGFLVYQNEDRPPVSLPGTAGVTR